MSLWLVIPRDPLIFRDGKPFTATPGERSKSMGFPFPSTLAGAIRTLVGPDPKNGFDEARVKFLKSIAIRGPALVELAEDGQIVDWLFQAPADALVVEFKGSKAIRRYALTPFRLPQGARMDREELAPVGPDKLIKAKPFSKAPHYWNWKTMQSWLEHPDEGDIEPETLGLPELPREYRTHVSINPDTYASRDGGLFQTSGLEFTNAQKKLFGLAIETDAALTEAVDFLGGERRVMRWQKTANQLPECPKAIRKKIVDSGFCRLVLSTPAYFEAGFLPGIGLQAKVHAVTLARYQTVSGWDYENGGSPKPTRRLVPAGSVYFLQLDDDKAKREAFVQSTWLHSVSDDEQFQRDGFGLALLGTWDGNLDREMPNTEVTA